MSTSSPEPEQLPGQGPVPDVVDLPTVKVPTLDHEPTTREDASEIGRMFADFRAEVAALREEIAKQRPRVAQPNVRETEQDRRAIRMQDIAEHEYYCPACGNLVHYQQQCTGAPGALPHPPVEVVSTQELAGDPAKHTPAPASAPESVVVIPA